MLGNGEFYCTRADVAKHLKSEINICSPEEHVTDVERCIRTIKERTRCTYNILPFTNLPTKMIIEMVFLSVCWLNFLPHQNGISPSLSPSTIVTGRKIDCKLHCQIEYGQYVQTHEQHDNSMESRTIGALALQPTGNRQGFYYLFSLYSRRRINHTHWTVIPMPE